MKNLNELGVQEMDIREMKHSNGGGGDDPMGTSYEPCGSGSSESRDKAAEAAELYLWIVRGFTS